jgi:hypothetical protein
MPGFDGSGPLGEGPMSGGGFGYCGSAWRQTTRPIFRGHYGRVGMGRSFGGFGRASARTHGWTRRRQSPRRLDGNTELVSLKEEAEDLRAYLKDIESRISELEKQSE